MKNVLRRVITQPKNTIKRQQSNNETVSIPVIDEKKASPIAIIYQSELDYISRCVLDYPNIETGGDLFGFWTNEGVPVVLYAIGPGDNANHQNAFFVQDIEYFEKVASLLNSRYRLSHMGEWHSHHQLGLTRPSGHDANTIFGGLRNVPLRHMLLCIANYRDGKTIINPYNFHENDMSCFTDASWHVVPMESPFRPIIDRDFDGILVHPESPCPNHGESRICSNKTPSKQNERSPLKSNHWLRQTGMVEQLRQMIAFVQSQWPGIGINPQWDETGNVQLTFDDGIHAIRLPVEFPIDTPQMLVSGVVKEVGIPWLYNPALGGNDPNCQILSAFVSWTLKIKSKTD
ncbi:MAG: hypothetical protein J5873_01010 [Bacteroidales bacterium]|nr:hypothetical protein [Bacteroidales bacterium]